MSRQTYHMELPKDTNDPIYHIIFDEYLQPVKPTKKTELLLPGKQKPKTDSLFNPKRKRPNEPESRSSQKEREDWKRVPVKSQNEKFYAALKSKITRGNFPKLFTFLHAREENELCRRKSGFEIYCELASVHGFKNFVGAQTWERLFWFFIVIIATVMSVIVVTTSYVLNAETPTVLYVESTTYPSWTVPFPAVTLCNQNRLSRKLVHELLEKSALPPDYLRHVFYTRYRTNATRLDYQLLQVLLNNKNYSDTQLLQTLAPNCEFELLHCKWLGVRRPCADLFRRIETPHGICCTFNYYADLLVEEHTSMRHTASCGYKTGLTVLIDPHVDDYFDAHFRLQGYEAFIHPPTNYPSLDVAPILVMTGTEANIYTVPHMTYASGYLGWLSLEHRRCYFPGEYILKAFPVYSQENCLAECRSKKMFELCHCVPPLWPRAMEWPVCRLTQAPCVANNSAVFTKSLKACNGNFKINYYAETFICDCFPPCSFQNYGTHVDASPLNRQFSVSDKKLFDNVTVKNKILLHVFFNDRGMERLRLDVYENWLSRIATFGGIVGLHMGYSFISFFEIIFFVLIRPACNWLTKKKIKQQQKKAAALRAKATAEKRLE